MASNVVPCPACGTKNRLPSAASGTARCASCHEALPWLVEASPGQFDKLVEGRLAVLVDLWAPWCGPCRMVAPGVERVSKELAGSVKVVKVNVDEDPSISARFGVQGIPTLLLLRNGELVARQVGALPADALLEWVRNSLETQRAP